MFNEKSMEYSTKENKEIPVWISPKYIEAKQKALEIIKSGKYDLTEGDFWILMNETKNGKMGYSGLIISHNGCLKINDKLDNKFNTKCVSLDKDGYNKSLVYTYCDDDVFEIGEVTDKNCKNNYPYAMAFKRCFDRVVLKKSKLAYAGVYSDSEADEFSGKDIEVEQKEVEKKEIEMTQKEKDMQIAPTNADALYNILINAGFTDETIEETLLAKYNIKKTSDLKGSQYAEIIQGLKKKGVIR